MPNYLSNDAAILIVEDEYLIAHDLRKSLLGIGLKVAGPVATIENAIRLLDGSPRVAACVLDINLNGLMVYEFASELEARNIPYIFVTGYERAAIPERFANIPRCEKPAQIHELTRALDQCLQKYSIA